MRNTLCSVERLCWKLSTSPAGPYLKDFASNLLEQGFSYQVTCCHLRAAAHVGKWAETLGRQIGELEGESVQDFCRHLPKCQCNQSYQDCSSRTLAGGRHFFVHLRRIGTLQSRSVSDEPYTPSLLVGFNHWMRQHRGVQESTLAAYQRFIRALLQELGEDPCRFDAAALRSFILDQADKPGLRPTRSLITATRSFIRYLIAEGKCPPEWEAAVPRIAQRRLQSLPHPLCPADVETLLAACSPTPSGIRIRAIILLCARLGLRVGDILALRLADLDWQQASLRVFGKGRREVLLPLSQEVGDALLTYIEEARPPAQTDHFFVTVYPPWRPLALSSTVSSMVARLMRKAGVSVPFRGAAHLLRHSAATEMLRQGCSLQEIGAILRHRFLETTTVYTKVDYVLLRQVAQPWPGGGEEC